MKKDLESDDEVDFREISKIPPAFSGTLVDWRIGSREITATLLDLAARGYIAINNNAVERTGRAPGKKFESDFLDRLFGNKKSLDFGEVSSSAYGAAFQDLIKIMAKGMIDENLIDKDFQKKLAQYTADAIKKMAFSFFPQKNLRINFSKQDNSEKAFSGSEIPPEALEFFALEKEQPIPNKVTVISWWQVAATIIILTIIAMFVSPFFSLLTELIVMVNSLIILVCISVWVSAFPIVSEIQKKTGTSLDWLLTEKGKSAKEQSLKLKEYMEKFPLAEDRLANELVGHSVAFGIGKKWMDKLSDEKASWLLFFESLSTQGETMINFMDYPSYLAETRKEVKDWVFGRQFKAGFDDLKRAKKY